HSSNESYEVQINDNADVCINIVAVKRQGEFLLQTVASLLDSIVRNPLLRINVVICDVSATPNEELQQLKPYVRAFLKGIFFSRITCICQRVASKISRYLLLMEDDVVVTPKFSPLLTSLVKQMDSKPDIHYVKLFHPIHLRGIPYYFQVQTIFLFNVRIFFCTFSFFYIIELSESCCTPAVLYRTDKISGITDYLSKFKDSGEPKDILLDNSPFQSRMTDANVVLHIGYFSSLRNNYVVLDVIKQYHKQLRHFFPF
uniref:Glyco_trans_2-like domain-containing protein n=1 Tax=Syphacia muris TaxID=451379 RepID=A0A0N5AFZ5_9BILA